MLLETKQEFKAGKLGKQDYIDRMYSMNNALFEYSRLLDGTDISGIEITPEGVVFTTREEGVRIFCTKNDKRAAPFEIMNFDTYESGDSKMIYGLIEDGFRIFDIGANIGYYSMTIAKKYPNARIFSFEPIPRTFGNLERNVALNGFKNIEIRPFGFSDTDKQLEFYVSEETSVSSSAANITGAANLEKVTCSVKSMDRYLADADIAMHFIKCDVEGGELFVSQGGIKSIERHKPIVFAEMLRKWSAKFNYHPNDIIRLFAPIGYSCFLIRDERYLVPIESVTAETAETNFFFLHRDKHLNIINKYASR